MSKPFLFLDIDGVLSPFVDNSPCWDDWEDLKTTPYHLPLSQTMANELAALPVEIVWLTTWEDDANLVVGPILGWSYLPVLHASLHPRKWWKLEALQNFIATDPRPFIWLDDELFIKREARSWAQTWSYSNNLPNLLISPSENAGFSKKQLRQVKEFLASLT